MTTRLTKPVSRVSGEVIRDAGKFRQLVVTIYPNGLIGLRPQGTRREETLSIPWVYLRAVEARVLREKEAKRKAKGKR